MSNEVIGYERALACTEMIADPGAGGTISVTKRDNFCAVMTAAAEARTLAPPLAALLRIQISLASDGGDLTLTVTNGFNQEGSTELVFDDAGDHVTFESIKIGSTYEWRIASSSGVTGTGLEGAVDATTLTVATSVTLADAVDVAVNATTGSKIGTDVTQKIGFWNVTPVVQPAGAAQADQGAMTTVGSNTGTSGAGLSLIGDTTSVNQAAALMNDLLALQEDIAALDVIVTAIRTALVDTGIIKGAA